MEHPLVTSTSKLRLLGMATLICLVVLVVANRAAAEDEAAESAWKAAFPHLPMPASLMWEESTLTASEAHLWAASLRDSSTAFDSSLFCSQATIQCSPQVRSALLHKSPYDDQNYDGTYDCEPPYTASKHVQPGFFFPLRTLSRGASIIMPTLNHPVPSHQYLPLTITQHLPLTPAKLPELLRIFGISNTSQMGHSMAYTVMLCSKPDMEGSHKGCTSSIEEMVEYVTTQLGSNVAVLESQATPKYLDKAPEDVKAVITSRTQITDLQSKTVVCHKVMFPSMVRLCHNLDSTRLYEVELMPEGGRRPLRVFTICHFDTSKWSKNHPSFGMVGTTPGKGEICHWIRSNEYIWITV